MYTVYLPILACIIKLSKAIRGEYDLQSYTEEIYEKIYKKSNMITISKVRAGATIRCQHRIITI